MRSKAVQHSAKPSTDRASATRRAPRTCGPHRLFVADSPAAPGMRSHARALLRADRHESSSGTQLDTNHGLQTTIPSTRSKSRSLVAMLRMRDRLIADK